MTGGGTHVEADGEGSADRHRTADLAVVRRPGCYRSRIEHGFLVEKTFPGYQPAAAPLRGAGRYSARTVPAVWMSTRLRASLFGDLQFVVGPLFIVRDGPEPPVLRGRQAHHLTISSAEENLRKVQGG